MQVLRRILKIEFVGELFCVCLRIVNCVDIVEA